MIHVVHQFLGRMGGGGENIELVSHLLFHRPEASSTPEMDFDQTDMIILPPPDLYADLIVE